MDNLKLKIKEILRYDLEYIPESISDYIVYKIDSDI